MESILRRLANCAADVNATQHSGAKVQPEQWSLLHQLTQEAFGALAKAREQAKESS